MTGTLSQADTRLLALWAERVLSARLRAELATRMVVECERKRDDVMAQVGKEAGFDHARPMNLNEDTGAWSQEDVPIKRDAE